MRHVEFFHKEHFENNYHRVLPPVSLSHFIDFFWETNFDKLWKQYPKGFSDALFPNIGYTYLINLGSPFTMQVDNKKFDMKTDGFLPRHKAIECYHRPGNKLFGIKFKISPVIFEKKINFSEYNKYIFPLSYLLDQSVISKIKKAPSFAIRVRVLNHYFQSIIEKYAGATDPIRIVSDILQHCETQNDYTTTIEEFAKRNKISTRTLQRHFEMSTGLSSKKILQIMRIRKAVAQLSESPGKFHYSLFGYYDHSHFYKHLKGFVDKKTLRSLQPHLKLLKLLHK